MDIKKYEVLLDTIGKGSFIKVCDEVGYTQAGISHMMNSLEREIGFRLLRRSNKGVLLTQEGQQVLPTIKELVRISDKLNQEFDLIRGLETGKVRIGSFPTMAGVWLPHVIRSFHERYPAIQIELVEEDSMWRLEEWLSDGFIELCFISRQPHHTFEWIDLKRDLYLVVLPEHHPLTEYDQVPAEMLMKEPFIMCRSLDGPDMDISRYFEQMGIQEKATFASNSDYTILFMVEQNLGISLLPELILNKVLGSYFKGLVIKPLYPPAYRQLGMAVRSLQGVSPAMERFIKCTKEILLSGE
ncbi:LysR family transcriptional regulator [Clostridium aminobutyricum]|uniref:LysR family transcriptional regulator n=1 Tax=Clostridium aminobutyricum TaxID=33953 RepID=A0A939IJZ5_CLOAM|nr:LysR substrate-binding domain-containing protein [Clostridium aminobutyricum]MBN7774103.1 LysR family transcriptional regulator [Clostridium aminobutyricum]